MIGLCQEGKSSPDALRRSAGVSSFSGSSPRVLASQPWFLFPIEQDLARRAKAITRGKGICQHLFTPVEPRVETS
jgi:hypothetical protein